MEIFTLIKANIRHKKGSFFSIIILMIIISSALTSILSVRDSSVQTIENALTYVDAANLSALMGDSYVTDDFIASLEKNTMVDRVEKLTAIPTSYTELDDKKDTNAWCLLKYENKYRLLNDDLSGYIEESKKPQKGEIYLPQGTLSLLKCSVGDTITIHTTNYEYKFKISGVVVEPNQGCQFMGVKRAFISDEDFDTLYSENTDEHLHNIIAIYKSPECELPESKFRRQLNLDTGIVDKSAVTLTRWESFYYTNLLTDIVSSVLMVFLVFLMIIVLIVMKNSISTSIEIDYKNLGMLKALGYTSHKIKLIFILQYIFAQVIGALIGFVIAIPLSGLIGSLFQPITAIPNENKISVLKSITVLLGVLVISSVFVYMSTRKIAKVSPMRAISGIKNEIYFDSRITAPISQKLLSPSLALRQFTSSKRRYISTIIITTLLVFFMLTATALADSMSSKNTMEAMGEIITECRLYFKNQGDDFDKIDEIETVIKEYSEIEKKHYMIYEYLSIDGESLQCRIYKNPDVINVYKGRYPLYDNEIVITEIVAKELDIKMGDTVTVSCGDEKAEYMITGYFQSTNDVGRCFAINLDVSTRIGIDFVNYASYSLSDTSRCDELEKALNDKYGDILRCETNVENSINSTQAVVTNAMKLIIYIFSVIFTLVVITMVCKKAFLQEKTDIGIYKAIGFKVSSLRLQFAVRFLIVSVIGSAIASVLSYLFSSKLLSLLLKSMGITNMTVGFKVLTFAIPIVIILICFFLFSYIVSRKIKEVEVTELIVE